MSDLYDRLRERSQRLCITDQDLADNILFREAADYGHFGKADLPWEAIDLF